MFIGIDISTHCGFAAVKISTGVPLLIKSKVLEPAGVGMVRAIKLADLVLDEMAEYDKIDAVVIEGYSFASKFSQAGQVEMGTMVRYNLIKSGFTPLICQPTTLKKFVAGTGNVKGKAPMVLAAFKKWGFDLPNDNECDAACLAVIGAAHQLAYLPQADYMQAAASMLTPCK